jgi:60 kDa SS-A/Ro ribonucleoprotein
LEASAIISEYGLPWEAVPDALLNEPLVLGALIPSMGQTALIRNLSRFTRAGIDSSVLTSLVANRDRLIEGRVHPISVLLALSSYASGRSKGGKEWAPQAKILDALNDAFYLAFAAVEPANKRTMLALDVSGSMAMADIANTSLTPREASVAMAMVTLASEPWVSIMGFSNNFVPLPISSRQRRFARYIAVRVLDRVKDEDEVVGLSRKLCHGGIDLALHAIHGCHATQ